MSGGFGLIRYLRHYKKESVIGPLFKLLEAVFELIVPLMMARLIDVGVRGGDTGVILKIGGLMVGMGVLGLVCSLTAQYFAAKAAMGFGAQLRDALFAHIGRLSHAQLDRVGASTLITRVTADVDRAQAGVNLFLRLFLRSPFIVAGAIVMALVIDRRLTLIFLAATPLIALVIYWVIASTLPGHARIREILDRLSLIVRENLRGVRVIRAFSRQREEAERFDREAEQMMRAQLAVGRISALNNPLTYALVNLAIIAILWFGGHRVDEGAILQGELIALISYMSQILLALVALANLIVVFSKALASASRIEALFDVEPSIANGAGATPSPGAPRVEFDGVSFHYAGGRNVLTDISFCAMAGQTIGIVGGTGAGKTTLVNLIGRFYEATGGSVRIDGASVRDYPLDQLRARIGVTPQAAMLFSGSVRDNMRWGKPDASDEEIWRALEIAQAADFISARPEGLDAPVEQGGVNFSGGQRQRLTIARALAGRPDILILDDSASALDYATDALLRCALREKAKGMTVFVVSQRISAVRSADHILVLDEGRLVAQGAHQALYDQSEVYRAICDSQSSGGEVAV
jgi:ATP-binding cassette subfamily B multidrug efflux pump